MERDDNSSIPVWFADRFDRFDTKMEDEFRLIKREMFETRHAQKGSIDQIAIEVASLVVQMNALAQTQVQTELWRSEGGPLDQRFHRHDERIRSNDMWRNRMMGALALITILFPVCVGVLVTTLRSS